ncbi:MAG: NADH-quinone oxidoreductase subunit C [candidate division Zixibacteria bacterium]|nr:NADH-quinone oxidoreductase subunit C [candidate division Zixibacteria bacterium]
MTKEELISYIQENFSGKVELIENDMPEPYFLIEPKAIVAFSRFIHDDNKLIMHFLMNLSGVDTKENMEVVYNVCSYRLKHRLFFKTVLPHEKAEVDTVKEIWAVADWHEREAWELFGINFNGHPNLTRFLLPDDWDQGHPLRKDWVGRDVIPFPEGK